MLPGREEGSHDCGSVVGWVETEGGHCVMETQMTAFANFVMGFSVVKSHTSCDCGCKLGCS